MATIQQEIESTKQKAELLQRLSSKFIDVEQDTDRWGNVRYFAASANIMADKVHLHHSCGCCSDAVLYARPYVDFDGVRVYSKPCLFTVGEKQPHNYRDRPYEGWEDSMREHGISSDVIRSVREYFRSEGEESN